jgi:hypothetical protein
MIVETANIMAEDGIAKRQRVKFKLLLGASYVYEDEFTIYDVNGIDIVLGTRWMRNINLQYQIDHVSIEIWVADNLCEERENGKVYSLPGLRALDVDEGIVEQAKFMAIHIIRNPELKNVSAPLLKRAFLIKVYHHGDGSPLKTDEPPGEVQEMLTASRASLASQYIQIRRMEGKPIWKLKRTQMAKYRSAHHTASPRRKMQNFGGR